MSTPDPTKPPPAPADEPAGEAMRNRSALVPGSEPPLSAPSREATAREHEGEPGPDGAWDTVREPTLNPPPSLPSARISTVLETVVMPAVWLDRLIALTQELPFDQGDEPLVAALVNGLERIAPELRVAIRLPSRAAAFPSIAPPKSLTWSEPPRSNERPRSARLFPDAVAERSVVLPGPGAGGALHFAAEQDLFASDASPHVQLLDRASVVVAHAIARQRAEERAEALEAELQSTKAQMVQAEKLASLGQIAAGMVHELNNPLTSIAAYTDFLLRRTITRDGPNSDDGERLRRIAESANRMLRFTRDLVSYARPSGDVPIQVHLNVVIERALAFCEHEVADADVEVQTVLDGQVGLVRGLPEQLAQVFVNLVTNACHAMATARDEAKSETTDGWRRKSVLRVTTSHVPEAVDGDGDPGPALRVVVEDTGCGIQPENLERVFKPFFTTKGAGRGTGLGLSIVKNIVDSHRGKIRAESDPSFGTRFVLVFPVEPGSMPAAQEPDPT